MKLEKMVLANSFALTTAILWVVCYLLVWLLPDQSATVLGWWAHGRDLSILGERILDWENILLGGISLSLAFWVVGYVFGWVWEWLSKK